MLVPYKRCTVRECVQERDKEIVGVIAFDVSQFKVLVPYKRCTVRECMQERDKAIAGVYIIMFCVNYVSSACAVQKMYCERVCVQERDKEIVGVIVFGVCCVSYV